MGYSRVPGQLDLSFRNSPARPSSSNTEIFFTPVLHATQYHAVNAITRLLVLVL